MGDRGDGILFLGDLFELGLGMWVLGWSKVFWIDDLSRRL